MRSSLPVERETSCLSIAVFSQNISDVLKISTEHNCELHVLPSQDEILFLANHQRDSYISCKREESTL